PAHFLAETTRPLGRGCLHFHLTFISLFCLPNGNGNFGRKIKKISAIPNIYRQKSDDWTT
ncbi:MAG: hypothetical protein J5543_03715, partial [Bacteroidales bacterium]|nr:hypothetical protein [Bacteroidales bacterium]